MAEPILYRPLNGTNAVASNSVVGFALASVNNCAAFRFMAQRTTDIAGVYVYFTSVASAGTVSLRIETDSRGKPSGSLYDANAAKSFTPVYGWNLVTFDATPSTGLTVGGIYHIVLITTGAGTTQTLGYGVADWTAHPLVPMTAVDGSTRSNLAFADGQAPVFLLHLSDGAYVSYGAAVLTTRTFNGVYGTRGVGCKFTVPAGETWTVAGVYNQFMYPSGTPPANLKCSIYGSSGIVAGASVTIASGVIAAYRQLQALFPSPVALSAGVYRAVFETPDHDGTGANCWNIISCSAAPNASLPSDLSFAGTADVSATPTITWGLDNSAQMSSLGLFIDSTAGAGGGGGGGVPRSRIFSGF